MKKLIDIRERERNSLEIIKNETGLTFDSQAIYYAINMMAKKLQPQYVAQKKDPTVDRNVLAAAKQLDREEARKIAKQEKEESEFLRVMKEVNGVETENFAGERVCRYWVYTLEQSANGPYIEAYEEEFFPFSASDWHIQNQFKNTTSEQVEKLRAEGKIKVI
jgi:hypothetical protein